ncbi:MAG: alpha/beta fold hydrolase [Pseudomonadota bacterium]
MSTLTIQNTDVHIDGEGEHTLLMIHGWPDTHRLWDPQVAYFKDTHRCVRFTVPGFDVNDTRAGHSLDSLMSFLNEVVDQVSSNQPVTLMLHDWGCVLGYLFCQRHPDKVLKVVSVDVGDATSSAFMRETTLPKKLMIISYQSTLALLWKLGTTRLGARCADALTRRMAGLFQHPDKGHGVHSGMNYLYGVFVFGALGGKPKDLAVTVDRHPMFYAYATRKPFMFHSEHWLGVLKEHPSCDAQAFKSNHWVTVNQSDAFNQCVDDWLRQV